MILDGKKVAKEIKEALKIEIKEKQLKPKLAIILCGKDPASVLYTNKKCKAAKKIGIAAEIISFKEEIEEKELITKIKEIQRKVDGIMIQLPIPPHLSKNAILETIDPKKDVDGLTATSLGKLAINEKEVFISATARGILRLLEEYKIDIEKKEIVIINNSALIGKPLCLLLTDKGATVTLCHKLTSNLKQYTKTADIIISATGVPLLIKKDMVKKGSVIIDVGTTKKEGKIVGDVDYENVSSITSFITPVPGGVGPMTIAMLLENVVGAAKKN